MVLNARISRTVPRVFTRGTAQLWGGQAIFGFKYRSFILFCVQFHKAHEDGRDLRAAGRGLRAELAVAALNQAACNSPAHGVGGVSADRVRILETVQFHRFADVIALLLRVAEQDGGELLAGDRAGHVGAVRNAIVHGPLLARSIPRCAAGVLALEAGEHRDDHAAGRVRVRAERPIARTVHEALFIRELDAGIVPAVRVDVGEREAVLTRVFVERILCRIRRRHRSDRRNRCRFFLPAGIERQVVFDRRAERIGVLARGIGEPA